MADTWVTPAQAAAVTGLTDHGIRYRLRSGAAGLRAAGLARRVPAGYDGGRERWEISTRLVQQWMEPEPAAGRDLRQEELDLARSDMKAFELELVRVTGTVEATQLRAERDALAAQIKQRDQEIADLRHRLETLGRNFAETMLALTSGSEAARGPRLG